MVIFRYFSVLVYLNIILERNLCFRITVVDEITFLFGSLSLSLELRFCITIIKTLRIVKSFSFNFWKIFSTLLQGAQILSFPDQI